MAVNDFWQTQASCHFWYPTEIAVGCLCCCKIEPSILNINTIEIISCLLSNCAVLDLCGLNLWCCIPLQVNHLKDLQHPNRLDSKNGSGHVANMVLLWLAVVLYGAADTASKNILVLFEMIGPLHWDVTQVPCRLFVVSDLFKNPDADVFMSSLEFGLVRGSLGFLEGFVSELKWLWIWAELVVIVAHVPPPGGLRQCIRLPRRHFKFLECHGFVAQGQWSHPDHHWNAGHLCQHFPHGFCNQNIYVLHW